MTQKKEKSHFSLSFFGLFPCNIPLLVIIHRIPYELDKGITQKKKKWIVVSIYFYSGR